MYALIKRDLSGIIKKRANVAAVDPSQLSPSKPYWVPFNEMVNDQSTGSDTVSEPPVETIYTDRVESVTIIRDKTAQELDAQDQTAVDNTLNITGVDRALAKTLFTLVNDVRDLKGQNAISLAQFKNYLKNLVRN